MNTDERRFSDLRTALSACIGQASNLGGFQKERAVKDLIAFLWAALDTLDRIWPGQNVNLAQTAGGSLERE
jgi:hypothetical protein